MKSILIVFLLLFSLTAQAQIYIIANSSSSEKEIERSVVKKIFTLKKNLWKNGNRIKLATLPTDHPLHIEFCKKVLRLTPRQLTKKWNYLTYTGRGSYPKELENENALVDYIKRIPYSIGYINGHIAINIPNGGTGYNVLFKK